MSETLFSVIICCQNEKQFPLETAESLSLSSISSAISSLTFSILPENPVSLDV